MKARLAVFLALVLAILSGCAAVGSQDWTATSSKFSDPFYDSKYGPN